jgi:putative component of membrane protein insertase Oxa1/YidC/SpoIIIJ protein YidD
LQALQDHGAWVGSYFTVARLARCHPWCAGGCDEVPAHPPRLFTRLMSPLQSKKSS